nr:xanthine dehydrogenase/oxidase-like [Procambarus clarkii]
MTDSVKFTINGVQYEVGGEVSASTSLQHFLHQQLLTGTKGTCYEGGCGSCTVVAALQDPDIGELRTGAVHSCLVPVLACEGWQITTVEGLGNRHDGLHVIQDTLASKSGSQCGYCSPGMIMNMYGLTQQKASWTEQDVEDHIDGGNLCRCTGYRPILDAFKSIPVADIESSHLVRCPRTGQPCKGRCQPPTVTGGGEVAGRKGSGGTTKEIVLKDAVWYSPETLEELNTILADLDPTSTYRLVCGDTLKAVYKNEGPYDAYIYTRKIPQLSRVVAAADAVVVGANVSISRLLEELSAVASSLSGYSYLASIVSTWRAVASTSLRNLGSWGGNIAGKMQHKEFASDIFIGLLVAGAIITTGGPDGPSEKLTLEELLEDDLVGKRRVILDMILPPQPEDVVIRTFKIPPRPSNSHAHLNAGFRLQVDAQNAHTVVGTPVLAYGGVNPQFVRATATEAVISGQSLEQESVLQAAMAALAEEIQPDSQPADASPQYRLALAQNLLYKTILGIVGDAAAANVASGATDLVRPVSSGQQSFDQNTDVWPLAQPVMKLEAPIQCTGEAEFVEFMAPVAKEHHGYFVTSTMARAAIVAVDPSPALAIPGVITFVGSEDIPGVNNIHVYSDPNATQPVFAEGQVSYYGQPIGLVVASTLEVAKMAAGKVVVTYGAAQTPVLTIDQALENPLPPGQYDPFVEGSVEEGFAASTHILEGRLRHGGQYHFHMENQVALVVPTDDGLEVYPSSQWASETQRSIGQVLGLPDNCISVTVKRLGGAFGAKIEQGNLVATAAAVAATKVRLPVRVSMDLATNMAIFGGRDPFMSTYKVGLCVPPRWCVTQATITSDAGYLPVDPNSSLSAECVPSCYSCPNWLVTPQFVLTNTPCNTWCRTPGTLEGVTLMEEILEHVAQELNIDPVELRKRNLMPDGATRRVNHRLLALRSRIAGREVTRCPREMTVPKNLISDMIDELMVSAEVQRRTQAITQFNQENRWKKRGLGFMSLSWPYSVPLVYPFSALVSINARDGSVLVSHGGTEMGQGINTKVAQVAAYQLRTTLDVVSIRPTNTHANANSSSTSGSLGSDVASYSVSEACKILRARLDVVEQEIGGKPTWAELIQAAFAMGVPLSQQYENGPDEVKSYAVFGVGCTEVELDVLTGQYLVLRTDILEDAGRSLSPLIDIGQIEGGFVMGQGLFTTEKPIFDPVTGQKLSAGTWNYYIPTSHDIPVDFRVSMLSNAPNPIGVLSSKITAEPPVCLSYTVPMALRHAVNSARTDAGSPGWVQMDSPFTVENLQLLCLVSPAALTIH